MKAAALRLAVCLLALLMAGPLRAAASPDLYSATVLVTGTGEPERTRGLRDGLAEVVIKLTGDARLAGDQRLDALLTDPHRWVERFDYEDRLKGIPIHDEQGSRDRPFFLHMRFDPARLDPQLQRLGLAKWENRPAISVVLGIRTAAGSYVLGRSGSQGYGERVALLGAAARRGLVIALPPEGSAASMPFDDIAGPNTDKLERAAERGGALLSGTLSITGSGYWDASWLLAHRGRSHAWNEAGVSFDVAFLHALERSALLLSGKLPF